MKISQANLLGAPELVEEVEDEIAEVDATNGQLDAENEELDQSYQELHQEHLKVGLRIYEDMKIMETSTLECNMDMKVTGKARTAEGLCS